MFPYQTTAHIFSWLWLSCMFRGTYSLVLLFSFSSRRIPGKKLIYLVVLFCVGLTICHHLFPKQPQHATQIYLIRNWTAVNNTTSLELPTLIATQSLWIEFLLLGEYSYLIALEREARESSGLFVESLIMCIGADIASKCWFVANVGITTSKIQTLSVIFSHSHLDLNNESYMKFWSDLQTFLCQLKSIGNPCWQPIYIYFIYILPAIYPVKMTNYRRTNWPDPRIGGEEKTLKFRNK